MPQGAWEQGALCTVFQIWAEVDREDLAQEKLGHWLLIYVDCSYIMNFFCLLKCLLKRPFVCFYVPYIAH